VPGADRTTPALHGQGLRGMRERAEHLGDGLDMRIDETGTTIQLQVSLRPTWRPTHHAPLRADMHRIDDRMRPFPPVVAIGQSSEITLGTEFCADSEAGASSIETRALLLANCAHLANVVLGV
jgi:hypothetical protein